MNYKEKALVDRQIIYLESPWCEALCEEYSCGWEDAWTTQQMKLAEMVELIETYMDKFQFDDDLMMRIYKIAGKI